MVIKYTLLHKPTISSWPTIPRQLKVIIVFSVLVTLGFLVIVQYSRNVRLTNLYRLQATVAEILNQELKYMPPDVATDDEWKSSAVPESMIYAAYLDARPEIVLDDPHDNRNGEKAWAVIRLIAIMPLKLHESKLTCYYKYRGVDPTNSSIQTIRTTRVEAIEENWGLNYSAFFVLCDLSIPDELNYEELYNDRHLPLEVGLGTTDSEDSSTMNYARVHYPKDGINQANNGKDIFLAVCGPVMHHGYNRALHLVEYIEYHRMLGVEHFTFYNRSITEEVGTVLAHYAEKGLATILQWQLPPIYQFELKLRVDGSFAAMNDCLYRSSFYNNYKYLLFSDIDEFIVPRKHKNFNELLDYLDPTNPNKPKNKHASFVFRNIFFYLMYDDDTEHRDPAMPYLYLQAKTTRVTEAEQHRLRSKYIARAQDVIEAGNHNIWRTRPGASLFSERFDELSVDTDVAMSHHYRDCETETAKCYFRPTIIDKTTHVYVDELGKRVANACAEIFAGMGCPPPTD